MSRISDFLEDLDGRWSSQQPGKIALQVIGSSALMLQTGYERAPKTVTCFPEIEPAAKTDFSLVKSGSACRIQNGRWTEFQ